MKTGRIFHALAAVLLSASFSYSAEVPPTYLTLSKSPNDFELFANGGWDGNWYVGYNSMWIVALSSPPASTGWAKAYIGAKLGRMKSEPVPGEPPWMRQAVPCEIFMGIASTAAWKSSDSYFLTACEDIPLEGSGEDAIRGVGEARWFWRQIPLSAVRMNGANYLAIWSATPELTSAAQSPIIAAAGVKTSNAWLNRNIQGAPPLTSEDALETKLNGFTPSLALKLIPAVSSGSVAVDVVSFYDGVDALRWEVQVAAINFSRVRPQISIDGNSWFSFGAPIASSPYLVTLTRSQIRDEAQRLLPTKRKVSQVYIRITAWDEWENSSSTPSFIVSVNP